MKYLIIREGTAVPFFVEVLNFKNTAPTPSLPQLGEGVREGADSELKMTASDITKLVNEHLAGTDKFLVEVFIKSINRIYIFIDGDHGVTIKDCVELSRFVEKQFDRESTDFELNVSSAGADQPIRLPRQYLKNIGRSLQVKLSEDITISGQLEVVDEKGITLLTKGDKKKKTAPETLNLSFEQIVESKVIISFK